MRNRSFSSLVLIIVLLVSVSIGVFAGTTPRRGGELIIGLSQEVGNLDPHLATSFSSFRVIDAMYEGLLRHGPDGEIQPALATSWDISEDNLTYTFYLRQGVTFHDGSELTAEDVKASYSRILDPEVGSPQSDRLAKIEKMEVVNSHEIKIHLTERDAPFLTKVAGPARAILPRSIYEEDQNLMNRANGTGPFTLVNWVSGEKLELEKHEDYWMEQLPYLDGVTYRIMPEAATRRAALQRGDIHLIPSASSTTVQILEGVRNVKILSIEELSYSLVGFNLEREPLDQAKVRRAISQATDREEIIQAVYDGMAAVGTPISPALAEWHVPASELDTYGQDYEKARTLLEEAGYPDGIEFSVTVSPTLETAVEIAQVLQNQLRPAGIDMKLNTVEWGTFLDAWRGSDFDSFASINAGSFDPDGYYYRTFRTGGATNVFNYSDSIMDDLLERGRVTTDQEQRGQIYRDVQRRLIEEMPILFIAYADLHTVLRDNVFDFAQLPDRNMSLLRQAWID